MEKKLYPVKITIIDKKGSCDLGHEVGESWIVDLKTPPGICCEAFHTLWSTITVFRVGGSHPWDEQPGVATIACPDHKNTIIFEVRRLDEQP